MSPPRESKVVSSKYTDIYYHHFSLNFDPSEISNRIGDIRFVLVAGCQFRIEAQANHLAEKLFNGKDLKRHEVERLTEERTRFSLFKVGPVLLSNHGIGAASMSVALHEIFLMCRHANVIDKITVIRFGTCGGIGVESGTICITTKAMDSLFKDWIDFKICGREVRRLCVVHGETAKLLEILALKQREQSKQDKSDDFDVKAGGTISTNDFYEEQGRTNGGICDHEQIDKVRFLSQAKDYGVINMEMEANHLAAMCHKLQVPFGVVCISLNNRLRQDVNRLNRQQVDRFEGRLFRLNSLFIKHKLSSLQNH